MAMRTIRWTKKYASNFCPYLRQNWTIDQFSFFTGTLFENLQWRDYWTSHHIL